MSTQSNPASPHNIPEYRANPCGEDWDPNRPAWPHACDYKFNISEPRATQELLSLIEAEKETPGSQRLTIEWLRRRGRTVSYFDSQIKRGCFIQAGCVVTDGFGTGRITHVLLNDRAPYQFHAPNLPRRTTGMSAIFSTVLASFGRQDPFGHAPTALFSKLHVYSPWSLFSRKLLLPDIHVDSRFLGLAWNFDDSDCRYIFLLWHVRTNRRPPAIVVPARQTRKHDSPRWYPVDAITTVTLDKPLGRLALGSVLNRELVTTPRTDHCGLLPWPKFEDTWMQKSTIPAVVDRETVVLDLLRLYQQEFHGERRQVVPIDLERDGERALQRDLLRFLNDRFAGLNLPGTASAEPTLGWESRAGRGDIKIEIFDHNLPPPEGGTPGAEPRAVALHYRYLVECKLSDSLRNEAAYLDQCRDYQAAVARLSDEQRHLDGYHAIVLLHGLRGEHSRYPLQEPEAHPHPTTPIHIIRIALTPTAPNAAAPAREVAHAIIPLRLRETTWQWLLFTRRKKDPNPRLPGGKLERGETRENAIRREMEEELGLQTGHIWKLVEINPGESGHEPGFAVTDMSMKRGEENLYRMHPFVVVLTNTGRKHILANLNKGSHCPRPAPINDWLAGNFGHNANYANAIYERLTPELIQEAVIDLG